MPDKTEQILTALTERLRAVPKAKVERNVERTLSLICSVRWSFARSPVTLTLCAPPPLTLITKCSFAAAGEAFFRVPRKRRANNRCSFTTVASATSTSRNPSSKPP